jgi:hypothetical protein
MAYLLSFVRYNLLLWVHNTLYVNWVPFLCVSFTVSFFNVDISGSEPDHKYLSWVRYVLNVVEALEWNMYRARKIHEHFQVEVAPLFSEVSFV